MNILLSGIWKKCDCGHVIYRNRLINNGPEQKEVRTRQSRSCEA